MFASWSIHYRFLRCFIIKVALLPRTNFFFRGVWWSTTLLKDHRNFFGCEFSLYWVLIKIIKKGVLIKVFIISMYNLFWRKFFKVCFSTSNNHFVAATNACCDNASFLKTSHFIRKHNVKYGTGGRFVTCLSCGSWTLVKENLNRKKQTKKSEFCFTARKNKFLEYYR